jgi:hypothetical protein
MNPGIKATFIVAAVAGIVEVSTEVICKARINAGKTIKTQQQQLLNVYSNPFPRKLSGKVKYGH